MLVLLHNECQNIVALISAAHRALKGTELLSATNHFQKLLFLCVAGGCILLSACTTSSSLPHLSSSQNKVYAGVGLGGSFLQANTSNINVSQDNETSTAGQLTVGANINSLFALEGRIADLGKIKFSNGNELGYQVADVSGLYKYNKNKFNAYARAGLGALSNTGDFETRLDTPVHLVVGAGLGYSLTPRVSIRAEWMGHDIDVSHAQLSFIYHFNKRSKKRSQNVVKAITKPSSKPEPAQAADNKLIIEPVAKLRVPTIVPLPKPISNPKPVTTPQLASQATINSTPQVKPRAPAKPQPRVVAKPQVNPKLVAKPKLATKPEPAEKPRANTAVASKPVPKPVPKPAVKPVAAAQNLAMQDNAESVADGASNELIADSLDGQQLASLDASQKSVSTEPDLDQDGINDALDQCPGSKTGAAVAADGCSLFSRAVPGLTFWPNTDRLQTSAETVLDSVASVLKDQPDLRLTVAAYSAQSEDAQAALFLTRRRIIAITRYLSNHGIDATRLRPEVLSNANALGNAADAVDIEQVILTPR